MVTMDVRYLPYKQINKAKWDACLQQSSHGLIYSTSTYLDAMSENWDALVWGDYHAIMPLPWRKKFGVKYIYPPAFTQQLGITAQQQISPQLVQQFLQQLKTHSRYAEINFNNANGQPSPLAIPRKNYVLPLRHSYAELSGKFSRSAHRNIAKAVAASISIDEHILPKEVIHLHRQRFQDKAGVTPAEYQHFQQLAEKLLQEQQCFCLGARGTNGDLIAASLFTIFKNRITFIINGNSETSLQNGATHLLLNHAIKKFASTDYVLDFEGSDHVSFARFYQQYGAVEETYYFLQVNQLPSALRWLKPEITAADFS